MLVNNAIACSQGHTYEIHGGTMVYKHCTSFQSQGLWRGLEGAGMLHSKTKGILQYPPASKFLFVSTLSQQERLITGGYLFTNKYVTKKLRNVRMRRLVLPLSPHICKTQNEVKGTYNQRFYGPLLWYTSYIFLDPSFAETSKPYRQVSTPTKFLPSHSQEKLRRNNITESSLPEPLPKSLPRTSNN